MVPLLCSAWAALVTSGRHSSSLRGVGEDVTKELGQWHEYTCTYLRRYRHMCFVVYAYCITCVWWCVLVCASHVCFMVVVYVYLYVSHCVCCCLSVVCITYLESASKSAFAENTSLSWFLLTPTSHGLTGPTNEHTHIHTGATCQSTHWSHDQSCDQSCDELIWSAIPYEFPAHHDNRPHIIIMASRK